MLNLLGILLLGLCCFFLLFILSLLIFSEYSRIFGGKVSKQSKEKYKKSDNYKNGRFVNLMPQYTINKGPDFIDESIKPKRSRQPDFDIPFIKIKPEDLAQNTEHARLTWFGHSTFLLEIDDKTILIDPMFSDVPSPIQKIGRRRFSRGLPLSIEELPPIDVVLITHDHYDHLDFLSIKKLKDKVKKFYTPLGISTHLIRWGISNNDIHELDWYDEKYLGNIKLTLTPSHHYSGRNLSGRYATLWGGWIIKGKLDNIYLSGDGGYGPHFKKIGETYGPFDFAMIECGQYCRYWVQNHLFPEQTAQVALDVKSKIIMPIHWGAFTLAMHGWCDPVERLLIKAKELDIVVTTPMIGESFTLDKEKLPKTKWWCNP